jgi:hypothetical protein
MPKHTAVEMRQVMNLLVALWPNPDITNEAYALDCQVYADSERTPTELVAAVREMRRTRTDPFRPTPAEVINATRPYLAEYHKPFVQTAGELPPAPVDKTIGRDAMAEMRAAMGAIKRVDTALDEPVDGAA